MIKAVVFDIGNVLIEWNPERFYDRVIGAERRRAMFAELDLHEMNDRVDRGAVWRTEVEGFAAANPTWSEEILMWHDRWIEMTGPVLDHSVRLMRALRRAGVPVFALSNFGRETFDFAVGHYPFLEEFDQPYISGKMGMAKPDAAIYAAVEDQSGLAPEALLFVDDRADNIAAAATRGWQTHQFDVPETFATRLVAEGLLTQEAAK